MAYEENCSAHDKPLIFLYHFSDFVVSVISEDGNTMRDVKPTDITMRMWKGQRPAANVPVSIFKNCCLSVENTLACHPNPVVAHHPPSGIRRSF